MTYPLLTEAEQAAMTAMRLDGATVEPLRDLNEAMPDLIAVYRAAVFHIRVPVLDTGSGEVVGLEDSPEQQAWDAAWGGTVLRSANTQDILAAILATPEPTAPTSKLTPPSGLYAAPVLTFDTGTATQLTAPPGVWGVDSDSLRARYGSTQFASVELWFRWNGDATTPSGTTRQVAAILRGTDANNALEILWLFGPTNTGIVVQRRVAGVLTSETSAAANIPPDPRDGKWHKLRVDLAGSTLTVRCDDVNPLAWQGTISGAGLAITGSPGMRVTNGRVEFALWTPPIPTTATIINLDITPQFNRPQQGVNTTNNTETPLENVTYEAVIASGRLDRIRYKTGVSGFNTLPIAFKPEQTDRYSSGLRASLKGTSSQTAAFNRKCFQHFDGCRARQTFKAHIPTLVSQPGMWRLLWQEHQDGSQPGPSPRVGSSPPIQLGYKQHKFSGVYWIFLSYDPNYWNALGQGYESFQLADGSWPLGGEILWNEVLQQNHTYTFVIDITHGSLGPTDTETSLKKRGAVNLFSVDGVTKVSNFVGLNMYGLFNFPDFTLYKNPSTVSSDSAIGGEYLHEHLPGPNSPLFGLTP